VSPVREPAEGREAEKRDERGSAIVEFVWLGLLLLLPLSYIMVAAFEVQQAAYAVSAASRSAGRAFVLAPDRASGYERAHRAAVTALADQGVDAAHASVRISCRPAPAEGLSPASSITVVVSTTQPLPLPPEMLGDVRPQITVDSTHTEPYGTFREDRS